MEILKRDSKDTESAVFEGEVETFCSNFKPCIFGNQMVQFPETGSQINRLNDEFNLGHVLVELSVQYSNRFVI